MEDLVQFFKDYYPTKEIVNMQISPNDQSLDSQVNNEPAVNDPKEKLHPPTATNEEPPVNDISLDSQANNEPPPVYDPEEKLHSSPASTSKTSALPRKRRVTAR